LKPSIDKKEKLNFFILSILIHGIILLLFIIIKIEFLPGRKQVYSTLNFVEISPEKPSAIVKKKSEHVLKNISTNSENKPEKKIIQKKEAPSKIAADTTSRKEKSTISVNKFSEDTINQKLKFAATLLDSFLVRHPEYSVFILQEQAKDLVKNKNIKEFSRLALEKKINDELDEYLKQYFPEGSEHEINKYTGPGLQVPLDGFIESIKKIFE
jgi:flagellar biosynthesis GTPase FlhF